MTVTQIIEISGTRSRVYLDGQPAFVLYKAELGKFRLEEGQEVREADYRMIMEELLPRRVKLRSMNLLKSRDYTVWQLRNKLKQDGYPDKIIEEGIQYVSSFHYLDDFRYASDYIASNEESKSRLQIERTLLQKGICRETVEGAWRQWEEKGGCQDEQEMIRRLLEKRHYQQETADDKEKRRVYAFLLRRGFSASAIAHALRVDS